MGNAFSHAAIVRDPLVGSAVDLNDRNRVRRWTISQHRRRIRSNSRENIRLASQRVHQYTTIGYARGINAFGVDGYLACDSCNHLHNKRDTINALLRWLAATTASGIPGLIDPIRIGDDKMSEISLGIPAVGTFGLLATAKTSMQHDHKRCWLSYARGFVNMICARQTADPYFLCRRANWQRRDRHGRRGIRI